MDDHTLRIGQWTFQVSGNVAYVHNLDRPGDIQIKADVEKFRIEVFDDEVENLKAKLEVPYEGLGPMLPEGER